MKKLYSLAFYAVFTPAIALSSAALLAEQPMGNGATSEQKMQGEPQTQSQRQSRTYYKAAPANGMHASELIGTEISNTCDETVGSVEDLIIDQDGRVLALVVSVGGFLGMGERNVAIPWDDVKTSGAMGEQELRIDLTREDLQGAPEYVTEE